MRLNSGAATAADRRGFQAWRGLNEENAEAAREAEALWADAGNLRQDPATGIVKLGSQGSDTTRRGMLAGAAGFAVLGGSLWASGVFRNWSADYATGLGETRVINLPDGSQATLNARSAINLKYSGSVRRIELTRGQAFFDVAPDSARPFEVATEALVVTALGTAFDVDRSLAGGAVAVSVTAHAVNVASSPDQGPARTTTLLEGHTVVVYADGLLGPVEARTFSVTAAWRTGMYIAENRTLGDVVAALQGYHPGWIVIRGEGTAALRVNAVLSLRTPDESLDALAKGLPIIVRRLSAYLTVISGG